jgi:hypothetical protein
MNENGSMIPTGKLEGARKDSSGSDGSRSRPPSAAVVQVAVPFAPPPSQGGWSAAIIGVVVALLLGGGALAWFLFRSDSHDTRESSPIVTGESPPASPKEAPPSAPALAAVKQEIVPVPPTMAEIKPPLESAPAATPPTPKPVSPAAKAEPAPKFEPPPQIIAVEPTRPKEPAAAPLVRPNPQQDKINIAIERGIRFLKQQQQQTGTWRRDGYHALGYAALPGLTLLECGVPAKDPVVGRAASFVRRAVPLVNDTYDLSLALLFLDRLGEPRDKALIQQIALRLIAAQALEGGWTYEAFPLSKTDATDLMRFLRQTRPLAAQRSLPAAGKAEDKSLAKPGSRELDESLPGSRSKKDSATREKPSESKPSAKAADKKKAAPRRKVSEPLPPIARRLAITNQGQLAVVPQAHGMFRPHFKMREDNSNSQFAMLALWAARRHDVPTERCLSLADKRYHGSQNPDGGWGYHSGMNTTSAMTGVGLLGLAIGHASSEDGLRAAAQGKRAAAQKLLHDPAIQAGLEAFARYLGGADDAPPGMPNLYFLWTVERVAMLYNLPTIGGKDWYRWGVRTLLPRQHETGGWLLGLNAYPGEDIAIDTSFALLFLKRSNLVQDLTRDLTFYLAIKDPASDGKRK